MLLDYIHLNPVRAELVQPRRRQSVLDYAMQIASQLDNAAIKAAARAYDQKQAEIAGVIGVWSGAIGLSRTRYTITW